MEEEKAKNNCSLIEELQNLRKDHKKPWSLSNKQRDNNAEPKMGHKTILACLYRLMGNKNAINEILPKYTLYGKKILILWYSWYVTSYNYILAKIISFWKMKKKI